MGACITVVREGRIDPTVLRSLADTWFEGEMVSARPDSMCLAMNGDRRISDAREFTA